MTTNGVNPSWRKSTLLACGIALAVGWGIRGNFGHEFGAAFAGCLAVMVGCILSGREDWRRRIAYFAFFGTLGWGFGGSISYMKVIAYTHSGHGPSQLFGFVALFWIGFLWAGLGGAGAALPAVATRDKLTQFFKPILFVYGAWVFFPWIELFLENSLQVRADDVIDNRWNRHKSPLYWFDADYLQAITALLGLCLFDLWDRKGEKSILLAVFAVVGAGIGCCVQFALRVTGLTGPVASALTYELADPDTINPETGEAFGSGNFMNNWPQWFGDFPEHIGWVVGIALGIAAYFIRYGKFRCGASLSVHMAAGWLISFLIFPVFLSLLIAEHGGIRMTPPRSDDWAGITGVFLGMTIWIWRNGYRPVAFASVVSGFIGGLGFSGIAWLKLMAVAPGNREKLNHLVEMGEMDASVAKETIAAWANWQGQNWHSFLEQSYGFVNGIAVAVALALLAGRVKERRIEEEEGPPRRWTEAFAAFFVLIALTYVNLFKNVDVWAGQLRKDIWWKKIVAEDGSEEFVEALWEVPILGRLPGMEWAAFTPSGWFQLTYFFIAAAFVYLCYRHLRSPLAIIPRTALGKGQLLFLGLLWAMVIGNFERALTGWAPGRLLTEWTIFMNAILLTVLVLVLPRESDALRVREPDSFVPLYRRAWLVGIVGIVVSVGLFYATTRTVYGDAFAGHAGNQKRFGPDADWRVHPILKSERHR